MTAGASGKVSNESGTSERCPRCGTELWAYHRKFGDALRFVRVGTLDRGEDMPPHAHFFTASKHAWVTLPAGVPHFAGLPEADEGLWPADAAARVDAALAASAMRR